MAIRNPNDAPMRPVHMGSAEAALERRADGSVLLTRKEALATPPSCLGRRFEHWAAKVPDRIFLAEMDSADNFRTIAWGEALSKVRSLAQAFIERGLSPQRPVAVLSENGIELGLVTLACQMAGIPCVHVSPSYSVIASDFLKLRQVLSLGQPGLVFAANGERYRRAIEAVVPPDVEVVVAEAPYARARALTLFSTLLATRATGDVDDAHAKVGPDTIAKLLFTSGSTGAPKGVPVTQRMMCANQQALDQLMPFLSEPYPTLVDWLPWHHTFGGNNNLGMVLNLGGTFYIDQGRPMPGLIEKTVKMVRKISPTMYMGVPKGVEVLLPLLWKDKDAAANMFRDVKCTMFGGAPMPAHVLDDLMALEVEVTGERIMNTNGVGSTDAGPTALYANWHVGNRPIIGLPVPGMDVKVVASGNKLEMRLRGPAVMQGYWKDPERTRDAFDEEGFFKIGDAVTWVDPQDFHKGLLFNGRVVEDFKLTSGTWVNVAALRDRIIEGLAPYVRDTVITGHGRDNVAAMIFLNVDACRPLCGGLPKEAAAEQIVAHPEVRAVVQKLLDGQDGRGGSSECIGRAVIEVEQPSLDNGELTDKNSVSQRSVLDRRTPVVEELHAKEPSARSIVRKRG